MLTFPTAKKKIVDLIQFLIVAFFLFLFSYFSKKNLPLALLFLSISQLSIVVALWPDTLQEIRHAFGIINTKKMIIWIVICMAGAITAAILYRKSLLGTFLPLELRFFSVVAVLIGAGEEFIFRGFLFTKLQRFNSLYRMFLCSASHAFYKVALFAGFNNISLSSLFIYTFAIGFILTYSRVLSKSIYPCLAFHCLFDLLVYGDNAGSPWWVW